MVKLLDTDFGWAFADDDETLREVNVRLERWFATSRTAQMVPHPFPNGALCCPLHAGKVPEPKNDSGN